MSESASSCTVAFYVPSSVMFEVQRLLASSETHIPYFYSVRPLMWPALPDGASPNE